KGHILKLMFMITELFNIPNFFYIEDSVTEFQEFNGNEHQSSKDKSSCIRALTFMSKTMRMAFNDCDRKDQLSSKCIQEFLNDKEIDKLKDFIMDFPSRYENPEKSECKYLRKIILDNLYGKNGNKN
ncbi:hypothetical protein BpHYR1_019918, partial [Brachionus plicatilis]